MPFPSDPHFSRRIQELYERAQLAPGAAEQPSPNPYALLPDSLSFLHQLLEELTPRNLFEFGSGESTVTFASWSAGRGSSVTSVENDLEWIRALEARLGPDRQAEVSFVHAPLSLMRCRPLAFLTYKDIPTLKARINEADFIFLDGPQASGREPALYSALCNCRLDATLVIDDFNLYFVRDMLAGVPSDLASRFVGVPIECNSHGLYVLRAVKPPRTAAIPLIGPTRVVQTYWRTLNDYVRYVKQ